MPLGRFCVPLRATRNPVAQGGIEPRIFRGAQWVRSTSPWLASLRQIKYLVAPACAKFLGHADSRLGSRRNSLPSRDLHLVGARWRPISSTSNGRAHHRSGESMSGRRDYVGRCQLPRSTAMKNSMMASLRAAGSSKLVACSAPVAGRDSSAEWVTTPRFLLAIAATPHGVAYASDALGRLLPRPSFRRFRTFRARVRRGDAEMATHSSPRVRPAVPGRGPLPRNRQSLPI